MAEADKVISRIDDTTCALPSALCPPPTHDRSFQEAAGLCALGGVLGCNPHTPRISRDRAKRRGHGTARSAAAWNDNAGCCGSRLFGGDRKSGIF
jgi:hypothetical protein